MWSCPVYIRLPLWRHRACITMYYARKASLTWNWWCRFNRRYFCFRNDMVSQLRPTWSWYVFASGAVVGYRNWPRYGLRWSGLCCHCRHSTRGAGRRGRKRPRDGRPHSCCAGSGSTNHSSADRLSGQFLFYHEHEAIHNDKSRDDHDDEPPCWNALAGNAIVMMKASIDTVSEQ